MASFGASQPSTPRIPPPATPSQSGLNTSIPKRLRRNTQDSLLLLAGVLKDSNDLAAAQASPAMHESPRIARRCRAIGLVAANAESLDGEKIELVKLYTSDSDKVETCLALENTDLETRVMRDWASERF